MVSRSSRRSRTRRAKVAEVAAFICVPRGTFLQLRPPVRTASLPSAACSDIVLEDLALVRDISLPKEPTGEEVKAGKEVGGPDRWGAPSPHALNPRAREFCPMAMLAGWSSGVEIDAAKSARAEKVDCDPASEVLPVELWRAADQGPMALGKKNRYLAKLAEQAERFDEMAEYMKLAEEPCATVAESSPVGPEEKARQETQVSQERQGAEANARLEADEKRTVEDLTDEVRRLPKGPERERRSQPSRNRPTRGAPFRKSRSRGRNVPSRV